jgi:hypothetical protein
VERGRFDADIEELFEAEGGEVLGGCGGRLRVIGAGGNRKKQGESADDRWKERVHLEMFIDLPAKNLRVSWFPGAGGTTCRETGGSIEVDAAGQRLRNLI